MPGDSPHETPRTGTVPQGPARGWDTLAACGRRYCLATLGPLAIAGAHFLVSVLFLRLTAPAAFGLFAFVLVLVPFWLSLSVALLGAPLTSTRPDNAGEIPTLMKANSWFCLAAAIAVAALLAASGAAPLPAALFGLYGGTMCLRWFGRWLAYASRHPARAILSDVVYAALLAAGIAALASLHALTLIHAAWVLCAAACAGLAVFGTGFLAAQAKAWREAGLAAYRPIWRDLTQWSLLGVVTTELSVNAHAYLVTLLAGPDAFALIAAGALFMRPVSLCLTALPDRERPVMVERLAAGDPAGAQACVRDFLCAMGAVWLLTVLLAGVAMLWFPHAILKAAYGRQQIVAVIALWAAITAVRALRTPDAVLLQAAREYRPLAGASVWSSIVSLALTAVLLLAFGPVASLGGILVGDIVMTQRIFVLVRRWKRTRHGEPAPAALWRAENLFAQKDARRKTDSIPGTNPKSPRPARLRANDARDRAMRKLFSDGP